MIYHLNIPILVFLLVLLDKEVFNYEGEKIVILCILSFIITLFFSSRSALYNTMVAKSLQLKEEIQESILLKLDLEINLQAFWQAYNKLEEFLFDLYLWFNNNILLLKKLYNKKRILFVFLFINEQLNNYIKDKAILSFKNELYMINTSIQTLKHNFFSINAENLNYIRNLNLDFFFRKLISLKSSRTILHILLNKLNIGKIFDKVDYSTYFYLLNSK